MTFLASPPSKRYLAWLLWLVLLLSAVIASLLLWRQPPGPPWVRFFLLAAFLWGLVGWLGYRIRLLTSLQYRISRDAVHLVTATSETIIPLPDIQDIRPFSGKTNHRYHWWRWPSPWLAPENQPAILATHPPHQCLAIHTSRQGAILVSPAEPEAFIRAVAAHQELGPARQVDPHHQVAPWRQYWFWQQRTPQLLIGLGAVLLLGISLYLVWQFPSLPADVALHFNAAGNPDRFGPRRALFILPLILALIWFTNTLLGLFLYPRQRLAALMLWSGTLVLQGVGAFILSALLS